MVSACLYMFVSYNTLELELFMYSMYPRQGGRIRRIVWYMR